MPSFGRDTIRRFVSNCSEMKKMAARDFENLLQVCLNITTILFMKLIRPDKCAIPAFDGLLPEPHNRAIMELLFVMAHWHALAKLRMHNDVTLDIMQMATVTLGKKLRAFSKTTCSAFATKELHREYNARVRREAKTATNKDRGNARSVNATSTLPAAMNLPNSPSSGPPAIQAGMHGMPSATASSQTTPPGRRLKTFNLNTFKAHSLGYYPNIIRQYGTTDSYSTEPVRNSTPSHH
jgi:hypothetical protein